jgi:lysyl-tRNA synthetase class II
MQLEIDKAEAEVERLRDAFSRQTAEDALSAFLTKQTIAIVDGLNEPTQSFTQSLKIQLNESIYPYGMGNVTNREIYDRFSSISCSPSHINKLYQELAASQAEVERLKEQLKLAVMLAEEVADEWVDPDFCSDAPDFIRLRSRINQIKETLNPTDK